jgi:hypothetical protein
VPAPFNARLTWIDFISHSSSFLSNKDSSFIIPYTYDIVSVPRLTSTLNMTRFVAFVVVVLAALLAASIPAASAARLCTLKQAAMNPNNLKIKTLQGTVLKEYDESTTPAMKGNDCVELWCREMCTQDEKCKAFAYLAISGGSTTCTLYSKARSGLAQCNNGKCTSEYGVCKGKWN